MWVGGGYQYGHMAVTGIEFKIRGLGGLFVCECVCVCMFLLILISVFKMHI